MRGARDESRWTQVSNYHHTIPAAWVERSVELYAGRPIALGGGAAELAATERLAGARKHWRAVGFCAPAPANTELRPHDCQLGYRSLP